MDLDNKKRHRRVWIIIWKLRFKHIYKSIVVFMREYPPFKYFFYTLSFFEMNERYKKNLMIQKKGGIHLTKDVIDEIWDQSIREHDDDLDARVIESARAAAEAEESCRKTKLKLEQFSNFLVRNVEREKAIDYAGKIKDFVDPDDSRGSYERLCEFIYSVIKQHSK